jgi:hypothetical protein
LEKHRSLAWRVKDGERMCQSTINQPTNQQTEQQEESKGTRRI